MGYKQGDQLPKDQAPPGDLHKVLVVNNCFYPCAGKNGSHNFHNNITGTHAGYCSKEAFDEMEKKNISMFEKYPNWMSVDITEADADWGMVHGGGFMNSRKGCGGYTHSAIEPKLVHAKKVNTALYDKAFAQVPHNAMAFPAATDYCDKKEWPKSQPGLPPAHRLPAEQARERCLPILYAQVLKSAPLMFAVCSRLKPLCINLDWIAWSIKTLHCVFYKVKNKYDGDYCLD
jgi:hypothetical protein